MSTGLDELQRRITQLRGEYDTARTILCDERRNLKNLRETLSRIEEARNITQTVAQAMEREAHQKIARVVTACLQTVFPEENYSFEIRFNRKRHRTEAKLVLLNNGHEIGNPLDGESGGVLDITCFALQLSAIMLTKPALRRIMIMDEPFKYVSREYRRNVQQMLQKLAEEFDLQLIMVTSHQSEIITGKVVEL